MVIASGDGMDEISTNTKTKVSEIKDGQIRTYEINPADCGFQPGMLADYAGGPGGSQGADFLRFIMNSRFWRYIEPEVVREICQMVPQCRKVGGLWISPWMR